MSDNETEPLRDELEAIARAVWAATRRLGYMPECCVAATGAARRLVCRAGLTSTPVVVRAMAANAAAAEQIAAGVAPAHWPPAAWSVGVDDRDVDDLEARMTPEVAARLTAERRFHGHLILEVHSSSGPWVLDAAAPQFARPEHQLDVDVVATALADTWTSTGVALLGSAESGTLLRYERVPAPQQDYRSAADWRPERIKPIVAVARTIRGALGEAERAGGGGSW
jgi:hypothetical protein